MNFEEYRRYDALGLAELVRAGDVTPQELLDAALAGIEAINPGLNAVINVFEPSARQAIEAGLPSGPFVGVPFAVKDLWTDVRGVPTANGSALFAGAVADHDSELVRRYRQAGLVIAAKTNSPELGLSPSTEPKLFGPTHNPWRHGFSAGGSSGGAAAAVAAGLFPMAHATDGGGSIRIPSAYCGLFGLKPTRARVSFAPDRGESWNGLGVAHVVSRSVRDSAVALDATAGNAPGDPYAAPPASSSYLRDAAIDPAQLRVGLIVSSFNNAPVDPELTAAAERTASRCEQLGHHVIPLRWPDGFDQLPAIAGAITSANVAASVDARLRVLGRELDARDLEPVTALIADAGRSVSGVQYVAALQAMHATCRVMASLFADVDVLITPTVGRVAFPLGVVDGSDMQRFREEVGSITGFVGVANATGQPAMSLPLDLSADHTPLGSQVIARFGDESTLFQLAGQLERAHTFTTLAEPAA